MNATGRHILLTYDYVPDVLERRAPHREAHLAQVREWREDGRLLIAGAVGDPPRGAMFVLGAEADAEAFAAADPYTHAGIVTDWRAEPVNLV